jgi:TIR domain-containing protein
LRLWKDKEAIAPGRLWEGEIKAAVEQAVFFIPIITPTVVKSRYCQTEFEAFLARERALERSDLVFPIFYVRVPELEVEARWRDHPVLTTRRSSCGTSRR